MRKLGETKKPTPSKLNSDRFSLGGIDNYFYNRKFGDPIVSQKGSSRVVVKNFKMLVNSLDNMINLYTLSEVDKHPPMRFTGHKHQNDFYGKFSSNIISFI
jgi:hypothetical protein